MTTATTSASGTIILAGDLTGTAASPQLKNTGVAAGTYSPAIGAIANDGTSSATFPQVVVDAKGRLIFARTHTVPETLAIATSSTVGVVKIGSQITSTAGVINTNWSNATSSTTGVVKVNGTSIVSAAGVISVGSMPTATSSVIGLATVDNSTIFIDGTGAVSVGVGVLAYTNVSNIFNAIHTFDVVINSTPYLSGTAPLNGWAPSSSDPLGATTYSRYMIEYADFSTNTTMNTMVLNFSRAGSGGTISDYENGVFKTKILKINAALTSIRVPMGLGGGTVKTVAVPSGKTYCVFEYVMLYSPNANDLFPGSSAAAPYGFTTSIYFT